MQGGETAGKVTIECHQTVDNFSGKRVDLQGGNGLFAVTEYRGFLRREWDSNHSSNR